MTTRATPNSELFEKQLTYAGRAKAEFGDPAGFVEGPARIRFNERGENIVEMTVENIETKEPLQLGLMGFSALQESFAMEIRSASASVADKMSARNCRHNGIKQSSLQLMGYTTDLAYIKEMNVPIQRR